MSSAAETLNKLKVNELKPILAKVGLPVSGKKNDLVDRILASPEALAAAGLSGDAAPAADDDVNADLPDLPTTEDEPANVSAPNTIPTPAAAPPGPAAADSEAAPAPASTGDAPPKLDDEAERRRKRAERFGIPFVDEQKKAAPSAKAKPAATNPPAAAAPKSKPAGPAAAPVATTEDAEKLRKRAERFGVPIAAPGASNGKAPKAAGGPAAKEAAPATVLDPAEEEKKRKRAERFGNVAGAPAEKKVKPAS